MRLVPVLLLAACTGAPTAEPPRPDPPPPPQPADAAAAASYTLTFPAPQTQYLQVEAVYPAAGDTLDISMAAWTPGSYLVRDYARHVEGLTATTPDGETLPVEKVDKDTWRITDGAAETVVVRYRLYARTLSVRGNWVEPAFAVLNGAPTFLVPDGATGPFDVRLQPRDGWTDVATALPPHPSGDANRFRAPDHDTLLDCPVVMGDAEVHRWTVADPADPERQVPHSLVHVGDTSRWDVNGTARDVERLAATQVAFWKGIPYADYTFQNVIAEAGGGLEHEGSTLMMTSRWASSTRKDRLRWLGLVSHEFFHTWNVKRLRPVELGPFDYTDEVHTRSLWVAEGLTSYYDDLLLVRAGLMTADEYYERLTSNLQGVMAKPGRFERSLEDASFDAWIKYYRKDENHDNVSVSYYTKGSVVGWMLDAEIRKASNGWASLDDALRLAYARHSGEAGYTPAEFQAACEEVAGTSLDPFFEAYVRGTAEIDPSTALEVFGLRLKPTDESDEADDTDTEPDKGWLGVEAGSGPNARVRRIRRDSPAFEADLLVDDEIVAVNGYRVQGGLGGLLGRWAPGDEVTLTLSRRGQLREARVTLGERPDPSRWTVQEDPMAPIEARDTRSRWLAVTLPEAEAPAPAAE